jgi:hypothetical protein
MSCACSRDEADKHCVLVILVGKLLDKIKVDIKESGCEDGKKMELSLNFVCIGVGGSLDSVIGAG